MSIEAGNILRETREQKGISIKDASDSLHIRIPYLQALESGRAEIIPSSVQARGFLRIYAEYLNLSAADVIQEWDNPGSTPLSAAKEEAPEKKPVPDNTAPVIPPIPQQPVPGINNVPGAGFIQYAGTQQSAGPQPNPQFYQNNLSNNSFYQNTQPQVNPSMDFAAPVPNAEPIGAITPSDDQNKEKNQKQSVKKGLFQKKNKEEPKEPEQKESAQDLFNSIGNELSFRRKFLALSLEDCESQTLIRSIYLESMEEGNFEQLPSLIQARGMLNNYASFLDLDVDAIMLKFATALQLLSEKKNKRDEDKKHKPAKKAGRLKKFFTPDLFVGIFVIVGITGIIIYSAITITAYRRSISEPTPDLGISLLEQYLDTTRTPEFLPTSSPTPIPVGQLSNLSAEINETETTDTEEFISSQPVQLFINANQRALMRVVSDGKEVFSGRTLPNNTYPFDAENEIILSISNADAISVVYNQQNMGRLGKLGEVMDIIFTSSMAATPTPQFSPTPTNTYEPTYTPQPETPLATNTPTPYIP